MKIIILLALICFVSCSKSKSDICYECTAVSGSTIYNENVCTDGNPENELPLQDSNGMISWDCTRK